MGDFIGVLTRDKRQFRLAGLEVQLGGGLGRASGVGGA